MNIFRVLMTTKVFEGKVKNECFISMLLPQGVITTLEHLKHERTQNPF